jgi:hypothetical protein
LRYDQANGENTARSARALLKNGAAVRGNRLKITIDVADMIGSSEILIRTGRSFSFQEGVIDWQRREAAENTNDKGKRSSTSTSGIGLEIVPRSPVEPSKR